MLTNHEQKMLEKHAKANADYGGCDTCRKCGLPFACDGCVCGNGYAFNAESYAKACPDVLLAIRGF